MFNHEIDAKVKGWIEQNRQEIIDLWLELARIPSVVSDAEEGAPYGSEAKKKRSLTAPICLQSSVLTHA